MVTRILLFVVTAFVLCVGEASAQSRVNFQPCPPNTIRPDLLQGYPHWDPPGMGVAPVSEELAAMLSKITDDRQRSELTSRFLQGRTLPSDSPQLMSAILRTKMRVDLYLVFRLYNRAATSNDQLYMDLQKVQNPTFQKLWVEYTQPGNLVPEVFVCGSPIPLTSDAPDGPDDRVQIKIQGWHVSTGYEPGVADKLGRLGIKKISMAKPMPIPDDSPYKEEKTFDFFILPHCGNPGDEPGSDVLNPSIEVPASPQSATPAPQITVGVLVSSKACDDGTTKEIPFCEGMPPAILEIRNLTTGSTRQVTYAREPNSPRLMVRPMLTPGRYTCIELSMRGWKPEYPGGKCEFTITAGQETSLALVNVRDLPPPPVVPAQQKPVDKPVDDGPSSFQGVIAPSVAGLFGKAYVDYTDATPLNPGNADRKSAFRALEIGGRFDLVHDSGLGAFAAGGVTLLNVRGKELLKDAFFDPLRTNNESSWPLVRFRAGARYGKKAYVGGFVGYRKITDQLEFDSDGAHTIEDTVYVMKTYGGEIGYASRKFAVRVPIWSAYDLKRTGTYQQTKPGFNFPSLTRDPQDGKAWGLRAEVEVGLGRVNLIAAFDHTKIDTIRPQRFQDIEQPRFSAVSVGVSVPIGFGRR